LTHFIEDYAHIEEFEKAAQPSLKAHKIWNNIDYILYDTQERIHQTAQLPPEDEEVEEVNEETQEALKCANP